MVESLIGAACYVTFFALVPGIGSMMQASALALLFAAAVYAVLTGRVKSLAVSTTECVMYFTGVVYVLNGVFHGQDAATTAAAFLVAVLLIAVISRTITLERLLDIGAYVTLLCVATALVVDHGGVAAALTASMGQSEFARFTPLNNVANLTGFTFGAGAILLLRRALVCKGTAERLTMAVGAFVSCTFVLAASARSSIIALFAAGAVALFLEFRLARVFSNKLVRVGTIVFAFVCIIFSEKIFAYFSRILEFDSDTRGIASGGTGRTGLWARGVASLFDDPLTLLIGGGFRSSNADLIGFSTESSYITILLDSGIFMGAAIILVYWYSPLKALRLSAPPDRHASPLVLLAAFLTFLISESVFNRYLLAIGNPISLMTLLILFSLSMREKLTEPAAEPRCVQ